MAWLQDMANQILSCHLAHGASWEPLAGDGEPVPTSREPVGANRRPAWAGDGPPPHAGPPGGKRAAAIVTIPKCWWKSEYCPNAPSLSLGSQVA